MSAHTYLQPITPHPVTAPTIAAGSTPEQIKGAIRKGGHPVSDNTPRTTKSWNELRDEATAISLAVVDSGGANVTFRLTLRNRNKEQAGRTRKVLSNLIEHGGSVRILGPDGSEEGVRQS